MNNVHITAVFNPPGGYLSLYINGVLAGSNNSVTIPMSAVNNAYSFIGRSLFSGDDYFDFSLDEFRIYDGALSPSEIAATQVLGPDELLATNQPSVNLSVDSVNLSMEWPAASAGYVVQSRTNLMTGEWGDDLSADPVLSGDLWTTTLPAVDTNKFFRLRK